MPGTADVTRPEPGAFEVAGGTHRRRSIDMAFVVGLAALWGTNYALVAVALEGGLSPAFIAWARSVIGLGALLLWRPRLGRGAWLLFRAHPWTTTALGLLMIALPLWLIGFAEHHGVSAAVASVVLALSPAIVVAAAPLFDRSEGVHLVGWCGLGLATAGVAITVGAGTSGTGSAVGMTAIVACTFVYVGSSILTKVRCITWPHLEMTVATLAVGAVVLLPAMLLSAPTEVPSFVTVLVMVELGIVGTAMSIVLLFRAVAYGGAGFSLQPIFLSPAFSAAAGFVVLDQPLTLSLTIGFVVTCCGVALATQQRTTTTPHARISP
jgi:drug/metabolite transporter (DMT)-like permease